MFNKLILVGNLTRDIELKYTSGSNTALAKTAIATTRKFTANGEKKEEVCFVDVTFFGRSAEIANQYLRKGSKCLIEGRLMFEQWTDKEGQKRSKHSVTVESMQMLDSKPNDAQQPQQPQQQYQQPQQNQEYVQATPAQANQAYQQATQTNPPQQQQQGSLPEIDIDEDEIPF